MAPGLKTRVRSNWARTVLVCGDRAGRPIPVPDELRHGLETWPAEAITRR